MGIGVTNPTARLQVAAGTASAGTAPIKLISGTNLTTAETGAFEYDGSELYFTPSGRRETIAYLSDITGAVHNAVTLAGSLDYITIDGSQVITRNAIDLTTDVTGTLPVGNGGTGVATFGGTNTILYTTAADTLSSIATANSGILATNGSGVPSIATDIPTAVTIGSSYIYRAGGTDVPVTDGGTGRSSLTAYGLLAGGTTTTGNTQSLATGTAGQVLRSGGASALPAWSTATYPATAGTTGTILRSNGTNWVNTSATYPTTTTANRILYSSSNNVIGQITSANSGLLVTGATGIPSISTNIPTAVTIGSAYIYRAGGTDVPLADGGTGAILLIQAQIASCSGMTVPGP